MLSEPTITHSVSTRFLAVKVNSNSPPQSRNYSLRTSRSKAEQSPVSTQSKLRTDRANSHYSSAYRGTRPRSRNAEVLTSEVIPRIRALRAPAPPRERREPEHRRQQHRYPEHERRHALQPDRPCPSSAAAAAAAATAPSSSASCASAARPVRRLLLRLAGVLPHPAPRSHASRPASAAAAGEEEVTRRPAIAAAERASGCAWASWWWR